jgi:hypothetical protein
MSWKEDDIHKYKQIIVFQGVPLGNLNAPKMCLVNNGERDQNHNLPHEQKQDLFDGRPKGLSLAL